jgi:hypothetical protein
VNLVAATPAAAAGIVLFLVPGLVFLSLLGRRYRERLPADEALYLVVAASVASAAWVALVLAEAGRFSLVGAAIILALVSAVAALLGRRRLSWSLSLPRRASEVLPAAALLVVAVSLQAHPSEYLVGGRDPGTYVAAMGLIARTGGIVYVDPVVQSIPKEDVELFYRHPENPDFSWGRFMGFPLERPDTARVFPEFFHLFPAFGAYLFQAMGVKGALATPVVFGVLGTLGVFFACRRIVGPAAAFLGAGLLSLNVIQVWFARYPVSEPVSQFLIFLGLLAFSHWEREDDGALMGVLAGAALGLSLLVRIDSILVVAPLGLYLLVRRAHGDLRWRPAVALLVPFGLLAVHAGFHAAFWSRKYFLDVANRPYWKQPVAVWVMAALVAAGALLVAGRLGPRLVQRLETHGDALRSGTIALLATLSLYAYFLRPSLSAWAGGDGNNKADALAHPGWLLALDFRRLAAHDAGAFFRLGWFVTPLGLALGVLGLALAIRRWRSRYLFPVLLALTFSAFYFYKIRVYNDYFFALRRFVPVILPFLLVFAAFALTRLAARRRGLQFAAAGLVLFLASSYLRETLPVSRHVDWKGAVRFVNDVSRRFGPDDVVIFEQFKTIHLLSLPLWAVHGVNILELARFDPDPERLQHLIRAWRGRYRNIYFVHTYRTNLCGTFLQRVEDYSFSSVEWERTYGRPPEKAEGRSLRFTVSRVVLPEELQVPPLPEVVIGGSDDFQVSGFFDKEGGGDLTYRWTGSCASVYLPGARPGAKVTISVSAGKRPGTAKPPVVGVSVSGQPIGTFLATPVWTDHVLRLPSPLPSGPPVLRFDVPSWRPVNVLPGSDDVRDLGVMLHRIRIEP